MQNRLANVSVLYVGNKAAFVFKLSIKYLFYTAFFLRNNPVSRGLVFE